MEKIEKQEAIAKVLNSSKEDSMFACATETRIVDGKMVEVKTIKQNMAGMSDFTKNIIAGEMYAVFAANKRSAALKSELMVQEQSKDSGLMA